MKVTEEILSLVEPGHVWKRTSNGREATILLVSNRHIPEDRRSKFPITVTYVDDQGNYCSLPLETFVASREFYIVNPSIESRILNLFSDDGSEEEEEVTEDEEVNVADDAKDAEEDSQEVIESQPAGLDAQFFLSGEPTDPSKVLPQELLVSNLLQMEQDPDLHSGEIRTKLIFSLNGITFDSLNLAFGNAAGPVYGSFSIQGFDVNWKMFTGVYPVIDQDGTVNAVCVFTSPLYYENLIEGSLEAPVAAETHVEGAPQQEQQSA